MALPALPGPRERLFGTDGIRGIPGRPPLTPELVRAIAEASCRFVLSRRAGLVNGAAPFVLMGRDTRGSGPGLCRELVAGFAACGVRTVDLGVVPTPAVSYLVGRLGGLCGVVVSASHNPAEFNGIKFFDSRGFKIDEAMEAAIERGVGWGAARPRQENRARAGRIQSFVEDGRRHVDDYVEFLRSTFPATLDLSGLRLVLDCANGAASRIAPALFEGLGAEVAALGCSPNGRNINAGCGALCPALACREVLQRRADCGVSFDGDADRAIFCDERGRLLDGDALIGLSARRLLRAGLLRGRKVALTVMSNFGLIRSLQEEGVGVVSVPVGDRHVTEAMEREGLSLGGESSGHIIFRAFAVTGDGMLTALQTLAALRESGRRLSEHRRGSPIVPQVLKNLAVERKAPLEGLPRLQGLIGRYESVLKGRGRIFLRYSGTEPLLRIMIEGPRRSEIRRMAEGLARAYLEETGQKRPLRRKG